MLIQPVGGPGLNSCAGRSGAEACPSTIDPVFGRVDTLLGAAIDKLAAPRSLTAAERQLVTDLFEDDSDTAIGEVRANMADLRSHLAATGQRRQEPTDPQEPATPFHRCGNECFSSCGSGALAFNRSSGADSSTTFCAGFTTMTAPAPGTGTTVSESQEHILIHEGAHGTGSIACQDFAKGTQRAFGLLSRAEALHNADSYTALARNLVNPGSAATCPLVADTGDLAGVAGVQEPLAWLDRWLEGADLHTADLYRIAHDFEGQPWDSDGNSLEVGMARVAEEFPVTPPPAPPTKRDPRTARRDQRSLRPCAQGPRHERVVAGALAWRDPDMGGRTRSSGHDSRWVRSAADPFADQRPAGRADGGVPRRAR